MRAPLKPPKANTKAFTLIELLVVIAIIAVLAAILLPIYSRSIKKSHETTTISNLKQIGLAGELYSSSHDNAIPLSIHQVIKEQKLSLDLVVDPDDPSSLGQGGEKRANLHEHLGTTPPVPYRFSYWGLEEQGHNKHTLERNASLIEKGTNLGWLVYILNYDYSKETGFPRHDEETVYLRLLREGSVVRRVFKKYTIDDRGTPRTMYMHLSLFADFSDADVLEDFYSD